MKNGSEQLHTEQHSISPFYHSILSLILSGDGICCQYRRGWVSLTAPIIVGRAKGLAWGNNGEFGAQVDVYVFFNDEGLVSQVSYSDPTTTTRRRMRQQTSVDNEPPVLRPDGFVTYTDLPKDQLVIQERHRI